MSFWRYGLVAWAAALPLSAGVIDCSRQQEVALHSGDALSFTFSAWSYTAHAATYGAPADPTYLSFNFITAPLQKPWEFTAEVRSLGGSTSAAIGNAALSTGSFAGALYTGPVSVAYGSLQLSPGLSSALFADSSAVLVLRNTGGDVSLGLEPYSLSQDMQVGLSGGVLTVGGRVSSVSLEQTPSLSADILEGASTDVPEPGTAGLLVLGGVFANLGRALKRRRGA